ncbi:hypothetical protein JOD27_005733 [Lentzea nigeriaca]|nr:hypothetical protein [Lentzea nigeriaca]
MHPVFHASFTATCAGGCGRKVSSGQVMCSICAMRVKPLHGKGT